MAGDWIKVEKSSARKPEVLKLARYFNISQDAAFGLLVRFWIWLDDVCVDGSVDGLVDADVDALMTQPGLASMLVEFGWAKFTIDPPSLRIVNFDRHNGESSKKRALKSERQAKYRANSVDAFVDGAASTRKEKKREYIKHNDTSARPVDKSANVKTVRDIVGINPGATMSRAEEEAFIAKTVSKGKP